MKPALFIDFDGTLCHDRFWRSLPAADYGRINDFVFGNGGGLANDWMLGKYSSEQVCDMLAKELGIDYSRLWDALLADCRGMRVESECLAKIDSLRGRYSTALVTVNMDCFDRFTVPALGLNRYFDHIANSYNESLFKNGERKGLFGVALSRTGAKYANSILTDDSENACKEFESSGGRALKIDSQNGLSYWLDYLINEYGIN